jgi:diguanylate cyclase (GGDEF)-like protein
LRPEQLIAVLARFAATFAWGASTRDVVEHVATQVADVLPDAGVGLLLVDGHGRRHLVASRHPQLRRLEGMPLELGEGPCLTAHATGQRVAIAELVADRTMPAFARAAGRAGVAATFAFPLVHAGHRVGAIELYATQPVTLDPSALDQAQVLADVAGSYVVIAEGRAAAVSAAARLGGSSLHDPLTSLPTRRLLRDRLQQASHRADRSRRPYGLVRCDVDGFRSINHRYGHHVGDRLLTEVAGRLGAELRPEDTLARVGGDEFVIACDDVAALGGVDDLAARASGTLRDAVDLGGGLRLEVTVSVGCALGGPAHGTIEDTLTRAAAELARAKRRHAPDPPGQGREPGRPAAGPGPPRRASRGRGSTERSRSDRPR